MEFIKFVLKAYCVFAAVMITISLVDAMASRWRQNQPEQIRVERVERVEGFVYTEQTHVDPTGALKFMVWDFASRMGENYQGLACTVAADDWDTVRRVLRCDKLQDTQSY